MAWGPGSTYLWGYTPYLNVFLCRAAALNTGPDPKRCCSRRPDMETKLQQKTRKDIFALFSGSAPDLPL